jgi:hypothetical protein
VVCLPAGHFLNGLASGFNLDMQESNDPWFKAGQIVGMGLFIATLMTGPEDPLADAAAVRVVSKLPDAAKLAEKVPDAANTVYRGGTRTLDALTPAAKDLAWEAGDYAPGLSTFRNAADVFGNSTKAQVIDLNRLPSNLQAIEEADGHVTITTRDWDSLIEWSDLRGTGAENPLAQAIHDAVIGEVRR